MLDFMKFSSAVFYFQSSPEIPIFILCPSFSDTPTNFISTACNFPASLIISAHISALSVRVGKYIFC